MATMRSTDVVELLGRVPVFSTLVQVDLERIAEFAVPRRYEPGQVVFREGDASDTCYVVREGHVRVVHKHSGGRTITLARFGPGDIFGELAMFEDELRSATVEAVDPTEVVAVLGPDMRRLMNQHPEIATRLVVALAGRLREANERLTRQSFQTVQSRVAMVLSELVAQELAEGGDRSGPQTGYEPDHAAVGQGGGQTTSGLPDQRVASPSAGSRSGDVLVTATQTDLAQLAGSSRESASRFLAVLERAGVISQGRGRLVVHDPEALKQYVF
jgi:CRP-like cAMP-binding protein